MKDKNNSEGYTTLSNSIRDRKDLSLYAKATIWYYLSKKNIKLKNGKYYNFNVKDICNFLEIGDKKWRQVSQQLRNLGYLQTIKRKLDISYPESFNTRLKETVQKNAFKRTDLNNKDLKHYREKNKENNNNGVVVVSSSFLEQLIEQGVKLGKNYVTQLISEYGEPYLREKLQLLKEANPIHPTAWFRKALKDDFKPSGGKISSNDEHSIVNQKIIDYEALAKEELKSNGIVKPELDLANPKEHFQRLRIYAKKLNDLTYIKQKENS